MLQTLKRAGRALELFSPEEPEWGATGVAKELGISKSQAHELLVSLTDIGLLERDGAGRYRLGSRVVALHRLFLETNHISRAAVHAVRVLSGRSGETVQLAVWNRGRAICVAACQGRHSVTASPWPLGAELPGHSTGAGKVLLSSRAPDEVHEVLAREGLTRMTARTIVTPEQLWAELSRVRRHALAFEHAEHFPDTCGVAAPILSPLGEVLAAVSMSVPASRWPTGREQYTRALVAMASALSRPPRREPASSPGSNAHRGTVVEPEHHPTTASEAVRNGRRLIDSHSAARL
jgi:IclR family transcriptional regulator, KDG regulon repressor